jgi:heme/copper-type cytochrome/quinol oxidase subunit 3
MVVPSAEVTVLMGSTFLAVVLRQTQDIEETERQLGLERTAAFAHFVVRVESIGASFDFTN